MTAAAQRFRSQVRGSRRTLLGLEAASLTLSVILAWILSAHFVSPWWAVVALFHFLWMITLLFRIEPRATVLALPELVSRSSTVVAMIFIEVGNPIPELATVGSAGPYSSSYMFYMLVLFASFVLAFRLIAGPPGRVQPGPLTLLLDRFANLIAVAAIALAGFTLLWLIFRGLTAGFPLLSGIDRFLYRRLMSDKVTVYSLNLKFVILLSLGMVVFRLPVVRPLRWAAGVTALLLVTVYFLFGDKFFTQLVGMAGFVAPYLYMNPDKIRRYLGAYVAAGAAAMALVFSVTWFIYSNGGTMTTAATMERLGGRIVGQGELWYLQAHIGAPLVHWDGGFVQRNIDGLTVKEIDLYAIRESIGPNYFSNRYAPDWLRASLHRNAGSVTYTAALEALGLAAFGWVGLAGLLMIAGTLLALVASYTAYAIRSRLMVSALFAGYIAVQYRAVMSQGTPWVLFSTFSLRWLGIIVVIEVLLLALGASQRGIRSSPSAAQRGGRRSSAATGRTAFPRGG